MWTLQTTDQSLHQPFQKMKTFFERQTALFPCQIVAKESDSFRIEMDQQQQQAIIYYPTRVTFFRGLSLLKQLYPQQIHDYEETAHFKELNFLLEASRNAVMKVDMVENYVILLAAMGYTGLYLYTEDTYEIKEDPYFGYMRGRYQEEELKHIDQVAQSFGIEVVPCIQTLAHLTQALKWEHLAPIKEDANTLLVEEPQTYEYIDQMISQMASLFTSRKVHIGMDESYGVGVGNYLQKHRYQSRYPLIKAHLDKVLEIVDKYQLHPIIWSDFIYRVLDEKSQPELYSLNAELSKEKAKEMPKSLTYVFWDYGERQVENYQTRIANHQLFAKDLMVAGGIHIYGNLTPNHGKSLMTLKANLESCKQSGVQKVMATTWGDNGQEDNHWNSLPIMQWYAEYMYQTEVEENWVEQRLDTCLQPSAYKEMISIRYLDEVPGVEEGNHYMANPSKYLLWQDPLLGLFDYHVASYEKLGYQLDRYYQEKETELRSGLLNLTGMTELNQQFYAQLSCVLSRKSTLGVRMQTCYKKGDSLISFISELEELEQEVEKLADLHQTIWYTLYKPFGWEVLANRYGGLIRRLKETNKIIQWYSDNQLASIPELEEERLPYMLGTTPLSINVPDYRQIAFTGYN
ncbi:beta-N-acetylhexosaminidase [Vagococcus humatus]|uniref:Beta-N-acetylhexosaminidase n=1 Tax=Vagococcus humatus TaxID=1889241 RepID=A0A429Z5C9_9ENTE|nr:beta-N-acetylhexosaminidase [Vagococcus humatus]RST88869.1 beta-N-acetylhexosaminidase [Vagococcus humatus]